MTLFNSITSSRSLARPGDLATGEPLSGITRRDQVTALCGFALLWLLWFLPASWDAIQGRPWRHHQHLEPQIATHALDLNSATADELRALPGIGPALAARIVAERNQRGPFLNTDQLERVSGIGPRTVERLRPWVRTDLLDERQQ